MHSFARSRRKAARTAWLGRAAALLLLSVAACSPSRTYEVRGRVVGFGDDGRTVIVDHEAVPGLMPAMTMPFQAAEPGAVAQLEHGQAVQFRLVVTRDSTWIYDIEQLPDDAVASGGSTPSGLRYPDGTPLLQAGDPVPPFELVDQDGAPFRPEDHRGRALLVTFIYTRCPIPDYCPLLSRHFQHLQPHLQERFGDQVHLLSISFDPEHDTPEVLRDYARRYTRDLEHWSFATGTAEQVGYVARLFGVFYESQGSEISHNLATALIGPDGRVVQIWRGNRWTPDDVMRAVEETLAPPPQADASAGRRAAF